MRDFNQKRFRQQVRFLRRQFLQDGDLPFSDILSDQIVAQAMAAIGTVWLDRIYSPFPVECRHACSRPMQKTAIHDVRSVGHTEVSCSERQSPRGGRVMSMQDGDRFAGCCTVPSSAFLVFVSRTRQCPRPRRQSNVLGHGVLCYYNHRQ